MALSLDIADAVVTVCRTAGWSQPYEVERKWIPIDDLGDLDEMKIYIAPMTWEATPTTYQKDEFGIVIDCGINKKINDYGEVDELVRFVEDEFAAYFRMRRIGDYVCHARKIVPIYDVNFLRDNKQFASVVRLTFKAVS